ncbi:MAG TPA: LPS-assembly protein LptD [Gammaproteobacteria bacterium]|nr:LPS-assembly protein LptD [Gammaproteobacteria bacterium]
MTPSHQAAYRPLAVTLLVAANLLPGLSPALAAGEAGKWRYCLPAPRFSEPPAPADDKLHFSADFAEAEAGRYRLWGDVLGQRGAQNLFAEQITYDAASEAARAQGEVRYRNGERLLFGSQADMALGSETGEISGASFWLLDKHLRGRAETLFIEGPERMRLQSTLFTTCDKGHEFWRLKAARLQLDQAENEGIAYHARLELLGVPVFYSPYLSFPLAGRKTGFLIPSIGDSSRSGSEFSLPWYLNIAPDKDATLTPKYMSKRGVLWDGEFRYLNARSRGDIRFAYLPGDKVYGGDRRAVNINHLGDPAPGWRTNLRYQEVSDGEYLNDFGTQLNVTSKTHLESRADVSYGDARWNASLMVQKYQTLDELQPLTSRPYARLPQIKLDMLPLPLAGGLTLDARTELVRFEREAGVVGNRIDIQPSISLPMESDAAFLTPRLSFRHTRYALQRTAPDSDASPVRNLPLFSVDSGLFFERNLISAGRAALQTLEPRLFYLYVPYVDQSELIVDENGVSRVFDSSQPLLSIGQMFRDNRFNGADRVADANQLSTVLTSRFLGQDGRELASASLGRIFYFSDRKVTLPGRDTETRAASNWLGVVNAQWTPSLSGRLNLEWDAEQREVARGNASVRYHPGLRSALNLSYRFERDRLEQTDISFMWPLWKGLSVLGRRRYSIQDDLLLESVAGFEYESCCWIARVVKRLYRLNVKDETLTETLWLQLELKGLSSVGRDVESLLARDILAR